MGVFDPVIDGGAARGWSSLDTLELGIKLAGMEERNEERDEWSSGGFGDDGSGSDIDNMGAVGDGMAWLGFDANGFDTALDWLDTFFIDSIRIIDTFTTWMQLDMIPVAMVMVSKMEWLYQKGTIVSTMVTVWGHFQVIWQMVKLMVVWKWWSGQGHFWYIWLRTRSEKYCHAIFLFLSFFYLFRERRKGVKRKVQFLTLEENEN